MKKDEKKIYIPPMHMGAFLLESPTIHREREKKQTIESN